MLTRNPMRIIAVVLFLIAGLVSGQGLTSKGVIAGLNLANISGEDTEDFDLTMKPGLAVGGYATFDFGLPVLIRPEVMFSQKGSKGEFSSTYEGVAFVMKGTDRLNYIDINALAVYPINDQISVFAGPSISPFLNGKTKLEIEIAGVSEEEEEDIEADDMNGMDIAFIIGAGYNLGTINLEARYSLGLKNAYKDPDTDKVLDMKNNIIQIIVGYGF